MRKEPLHIATESARKNPPPQGLRLLSIRQVVERTGLGKSSIYRLMSDGRFPQHVKLTPQRSAWAEHEIDEYIRKLLDDRQRYSGKGD